MSSWQSSHVVSDVVVMGTEGHYPSAESPAQPVLTEAERTHRRCARIRSVPCVYLKCPPERKANEQFAMAALLGLDHHTHRRDEVLAMVNVCCPSLFQNQAAMRELFHHGSLAGIELIVMRARAVITWDCDLAIVGLGRTTEVYRCLPLTLQIHDRVVAQLLDQGGASYLGRFAPREYLLNRPDLILKCLQRGFRTFDIPIELRRNKEFIMKAVAVTPSILADCTFEMISDRDILLATAGLVNKKGMGVLTDALTRFPGGSKKLLLPFAEDVKDKLANHAAFVSFLQCISVAGRPNSDSPLQLLHCGEETSVALKREIADFLGAPTQVNDVKILNKAWDASIAEYYEANKEVSSGKHKLEARQLSRAERVALKRRLSQRLHLFHSHHRGMMIRFDWTDNHMINRIRQFALHDDDVANMEAGFRLAGESDSDFEIDLDVHGLDEL